MRELRDTGSEVTWPGVLQSRTQNQAVSVTFPLLCCLLESSSFEAMKYISVICSIWWKENCPRSLSKEGELGFKFSSACSPRLCYFHYTELLPQRAQSPFCITKFLLQRFAYNEVDMYFVLQARWHLYLVIYFSDDNSCRWGLTPWESFPECLWNKQ